MLVLVILLCAAAYFFKQQMPAVTNIIPQMLDEPVQNPSTREPFVFGYRNQRYDVEPVAEYLLSGLVVSKNDIGSIADIYHDDDSVDLQDLCIIWGKNLESEDFHKVDFWSNAWTCNWSYSGNIDFSNREVANNHLLAADKKVQAKIRNINIGDQVILQGMLVDYSPEGTEWKRISSRTREDTGNGACEVMFVETLEIVKAGAPQWNLLFGISKWMIGLLLILKMSSFVWHARREKKLFELEERQRQERIRRREQVGYKGGY